MGLDGKKTKLQQGDIHKIDFVPAGAQEAAKISLYKGIESIEDLLQGTSDQLSTELQEIAKAGKAISGSRMTKLKEICDQLQALIAGANDIIDVNKKKEEKEEKELSEDIKKKCEEEEAKKLKEEEAKKAKTKEEEAKKLKLEEEAKKAKEEEAEDEEAEDEDEAKKSVKKSTFDAYVTKMSNENSTLKQQVAKMIDERQTRQYIEKAAELDCLPAETEELGLILKSIAVVDDATYAKLEAILKMANEVIRQGALFSEMGYSGSVSATSPEDAWGQIETLANQIVAKDSSRTPSQAIDEVLKSSEGKRLYALHMGRIA